MNTIVIIPARYGSTRFPGKPLVDIQGKPMIQRVYEQVQKAELPDRIIVATDDQRIFDCVKSFGGEVEMTKTDHPSGTDRIAEVAQRINLGGELIVNVQGDEPFIEPDQIDQLINFMKIKKDIFIGTLIKKINNMSLLQNPDVVKVVQDQKQRALYFSRAPIPHNRDGISSKHYFKHIGMYAYRRAALLEITQLPEGRLEQLERLEQLRWLEHGWTIGVQETEWESRGIDRPRDLL